MFKVLSAGMAAALVFGVCATPAMAGGLHYCFDYHRAVKAARAGYVQSYVVVPQAAAAPQSAPQEAVNVATIVALLDLVTKIKPTENKSGSPGDGGNGSVSADLQEIKRKLDRIDKGLFQGIDVDKLESGMFYDLRGRAINNAEILSAMAEELRSLKKSK